MTTLREAAMRQALEFCEFLWREVVLNDWAEGQREATEAALRAALAEPTVKESLQVEPAVAETATTQQQVEQTPPSEYRRGYWAGFEIGKREGRIEAEDALAEPVQEPVAWRTKNATPPGGYVVFQQYPSAVADLGGEIEPLYTAPPQRKPLSGLEVERLLEQSIGSLPAARRLVRAIEQAHGIGEKK